MDKDIGDELGGFAFDLTRRNAFLERQGFKAPKAVKTGTTIVGLVFKDGVVLGADTRATDDTTVADKNCEKIHYIAPNIYCCGAGTAGMCCSCLSGGGGVLNDSYTGDEWE